MALLDSEVESATPDAWTGKPGAIVYDSIGDASSYLSRRGKLSFSGASSTDQEIHLIRATEIAEDQVRSRFRGRPVANGQGLLLPASGAIDLNGWRIPEGATEIATAAAVRIYRHGIFALAELLAAGEYLADAPDAGVIEDRNPAGAIRYEAGAAAQDIAAQHPGVWTKLITIMPRMI